MYTSLKIVKKQPFAWIYYPNGLSTGFAVSKGYFTADEATRLFQIVEQGKTKRPDVFLENITLQDESAGGPLLTFATLADLQQKLSELGNPLMNPIPDSQFTSDQVDAIQAANTPSASNPFATMEDISGFAQDEILISTGYTLVGQDITFNAGWVWNINGVEYSNPIPVVRTIPLAGAGLSRFDKFALNTSSTFDRVEGDEASTNIFPPDLLPNTLEACMVFVTDTTVTESTPPVTGKAYVEKVESQDYVINSGSTLIMEQMNLVDERLSLSLTGSVTDAKSIQLQNKYMRPGKPHFFKNRTGHIVTIWHLAGTGNLRYYFPNATNLAVNPGEIVQFNLNENNSSDKRLEYVGIASSGGVNYFKGVYATYAALVAAHPTSSAGDYAQVNEVGAVDVVNYNWDAEDNIWVIGGSFAIGNTDSLAEGSTNLYFTTARVLATVLSGLSLATGGAIVSTDTVLQAFGKIQKQINDLGTVYQVILTDVNFGTFINSLTAKPTPVDADSISIVDSADSNKQKKVSLTNFKAFLKTYFDTLYTIPQITITTSTNITNATNDASGYGQHGRNVIIANGSSVINYTINGALTASFMKGGTGAITFVQGSGRTLVQVDGTNILSGAVGSTATITSVGTSDYLRISNA